MRILHGAGREALKLKPGEAYNSGAVQLVCPCTTLGHGEASRLSVAKELRMIPAVMQELEWQTSCGCHKRRPALDYYLVCD